MIRVNIKPPPNNFEVLVAAPGRRFLNSVPRPRGKQWVNREYWRNVLGYMMTEYDGICAYTSLWIKPDQPTVDHYISRNNNPTLAYEWSNFRLARWRVNTRKNKNENVIDPFNLSDNWFILDFTTFEIHPNSELIEEDRLLVLDTIKKLDLNHLDYCDAREAWFDAFRDDIEKLRSKSPFMAHEAVRQGID